jgi:hypothetical protein
VLTVLALLLVLVVLLLLENSVKRTVLNHVIYTLYDACAPLVTSQTDSSTVSQDILMHATSENNVKLTVAP